MEISNFSQRWLTYFFLTGALPLALCLYRIWPIFIDSSKFKNSHISYLLSYFLFLALAPIYFMASTYLIEVASNGHFTMDGEASFGWIIFFATPLLIIAESMFRASRKRA